MNTNKKQTALEWLLDQLLNKKGTVVISTSTFYFNEEIVNKAKEMEREQIINAVEYGNSFFTDVPVDISEDYYKTTYEA